MPVATKMNSQEVISRLRTRYSGKGWVPMTEVRRKLGFEAQRQIDFLAINLWESQRLKYVAVEVKVDRADLRRELDDPSKREPWEEVCQECWFAAPPGVIPVAELPEGWGLLEAIGGGKLRRKVAAKQRMDAEPTPELWWAMVRRANRIQNDNDQESTFLYRAEGKDLSAEELVSMARGLITRDWEGDFEEKTRQMYQERFDRDRRDFEEDKAFFARLKKQLVDLARREHPKLAGWSPSESEIGEVIESLRTVTSYRHEARKLSMVIGPLSTALDDLIAEPTSQGGSRG